MVIDKVEVLYAVSEATGLTLLQSQKLLELLLDTTSITLGQLLLVVSKIAAREIVFYNDELHYCMKLENSKIVVVHDSTYYLTGKYEVD